MNPDFAQVEADVQQVNLTQFSQFFPEKREFFLENSGLFYVGDAARNNRVTRGADPGRGPAPLLLPARGRGRRRARIPITAGARLTGRVGGTNIGAITMRTDGVDGVPGSDYGVLRVRQNVFGGSDIGGIFMMRDARRTGPDGRRLQPGVRRRRQHPLLRQRRLEQLRGGYRAPGARATASTHGARR